MGKKTHTSARESPKKQEGRPKRLRHRRQAPLFCTHAPRRVLFSKKHTTEYAQPVRKQPARRDRDCPRLGRTLLYTEYRYDLAKEYVLSVYLKPPFLKNETAVNCIEYSMDNEHVWTRPSEASVFFFLFFFLYNETAGKCIKYSNG